MTMSLPPIIAVEEFAQYWRKLTIYEEATLVNFAEKERKFQAHISGTTAAVVSAVSEIQDGIISQVKRFKILIPPGNTKKVRDIVIGPTPPNTNKGVRKIRLVLLNSFGYVYLEGREDALAEVESSLGKKIKFSESANILVAVKKESTREVIDKFKASRLVFQDIDDDISDIAPAEALKRFKRRVPMTKRQYSQLLDSAKGRAFAIAGQIEKDILMDVHNLLYQSIREGATLADFTRAIKQAGIKYTGTVYGTEAHKGKSLLPYHLETILRTNFATVYNEGRMDMFNDPAVVDFVPAYQYSAILDQRTRKTHAEMDGKIYLRDDPIWNSWTPPSGYNCRCLTIPVTSNLEYSVSNPTKLQPDPGFGSVRSGGAVRRAAI